MVRTGFKRKEWPEATLRAACFPLAPTRRRMKQAAHRLSAKPDKDLQAWAKQVKERDGWRCQWFDCGFCRNVMDRQLVTAHHKALRSARPDLRLVLENGVTLCWSRHSWIHTPAGRGEAIRRGFLNLETYELARASLTKQVQTGDFVEHFTQGD